MPLPYGAWYLEAMDAHGGWISIGARSGPLRVGVRSAGKCKILKAASIKTMFARPDGLAGHDQGRQAERRILRLRLAGAPVGDGSKMNTWHNGALDGTATLLVRRPDGLCWAVLFNARKTAANTELSGAIDPLVHQAANKVKRWPKRDLFE